MEIPQNYEVPVIEILEVEVEKGFALSDGPPIPPAPGFYY